MKNNKSVYCHLIHVVCESERVNEETEVTRGSFLFIFASSSHVKTHIFAYFTHRIYDDDDKNNNKCIHVYSMADIL